MVKCFSSQDIKKNFVETTSATKGKGFRNGGLDHPSLFFLETISSCYDSLRSSERKNFPQTRKGFNRHCEDGDDYRRKYPMKLGIVMKSKKGFPRDLFGNERYLLLFSLSVHFAKPIHLPVCPRSSGS